MKRCSKCILPETYPNITFDEKGVCNVCSSFEKRWANYDWNEKKRELELIFQKAKSKKRKYDCIVPVSGGKDSAYTLYICSIIYKLNVLAVNFNNGFVSPVASQNLSMLAKKFDVDLISWAPKWSVLKKAYRAYFLKTGDFCPPCSRAITSFTYRLAQKERIPLIVLGFNPKTDVNPAEVEIIDQRNFKDVIGNSLSYEEKKVFLLLEARRFLTKRIDLPKYIPFIEKDIANTLDQLVGSQGGFSGGMHFDCLVSSIPDWLRRQKWGFGKKTQKYSALIRDNQINRADALKTCESEYVNNLPEPLDLFMERLELTMEDVLNAKNLSSYNFKHYDPKFIRFIGKVSGIIDSDYK